MRCWAFSREVRLFTRDSPFHARFAFSRGGGIRLFTRKRDSSFRVGFAFPKGFAYNAGFAFSRGIRLSSLSVAGDGIITGVGRDRRKIRVLSLNINK